MEFSDEMCGRCGQGLLKHHGVERFCPFYSTFRPVSRCDCGATLGATCSDCVIGEYQAAHPECRTCCTPADALPRRAIPTHNA